ncbi:hypothetical protein ACQ4WY_25505 [Janthinobacterium sp. LB2P49]|uniref:hypothetical protein n=1 Tax=Janthinobacterium sp. LB2P49 TaxID=3424198 RepID=UPI003F20DEA5
MDHPIDVINLTNLWKGRKYIDDIGATVSINLGRALVNIHKDISKMWEKRPGGKETFYVQERTLYEPISNNLCSVLPFQAVVDIEAVLKRLPKGQNAQKTDVSIRRLADVNGNRLDDHHHKCFVEIKSVFHGENIAASSITDDIEKLLLCESAYKAKCFFMLVGLKKDLDRVSAHTSILGLHNNVGPISLALPSKKTAWLQPSARVLDEDLQVYVWVVSNRNVFPSDASNFTYSVFQAK